LFFDPRPLFFTDQTEPQVEQPQARAADRRHLYPTLFFQEAPAAAFTDQPFDAVSQPLPQPGSALATFPWFFFDPSPIVFTDQTHLLIVQPERNFAQRQIKARQLASWAPAQFFQADLVAVSFTPFGVITRLIGAPGMSIYLEVTLKTSDATYAAQARLFNITDVMVVSGSTISTASLTATRVRSVALTLPVAAKEYRVEFGGQASVGATYTIYSADLIFGG
jgi:hypothetical protein